jgi:hypothetical protein
MPLIPGCGPSGEVNPLRGSGAMLWWRSHTEAVAVRQCVSGRNGPLAAASSGTTKWSGLWIANGVQRPANLILTSSDPIQGSIEVVGLCTANWNELQRNSDTSRRVQATVTSGPCTNNQWDVLIDPRSITGQDASGAPANFAVTPR